MFEVQLKPSDPSLPIVYVGLGEEISFGSSLAADYQVQSEGVEPVHCRLITQSRGCFIECKNAGAEVIVNGDQKNRARLRHGDRLEIGQRTYQVLLPEDSPQPDSPQPSLPAPDADPLPATGEENAHRSIESQNGNAVEEPDLPPSAEAIQEVPLFADDEFEADHRGQSSDRRPEPSAAEQQDMEPEANDQLAPAERTVEEPTPSSPDPGERKQVATPNQDPEDPLIEEAAANDLYQLAEYHCIDRNRTPNQALERYGFSNLNFLKSNDWKWGKRLLLSATTPPEWTELLSTTVLEAGQILGISQKPAAELAAVVTRLSNYFQHVDTLAQFLEICPTGFCDFIFSELDAVVVISSHRKVMYLPGRDTGTR